MQEIHTKLLISRLSLVQNIFYHYIHGMKRLIIPIICMLLPLAGCHERKQLPSLNLADSLLTDAGDKSGALRIFLQIEEQLQSRQDPYNKGLLYERIGSIYYGQMNYVRAYHYFKQARENFQVSIIRKTKCFDFLKRSVYFPKRNVLFFTSPTLFSTTNYR